MSALICTHCNNTPVNRVTVTLDEKDAIYRRMKKLPPLNEVFFACEAHTHNLQWRAESSGYVVKIIKLPGEVKK